MLMILFSNFLDDLTERTNNEKDTVLSSLLFESFKNYGDNLKEICYDYAL